MCKLDNIEDQTGRSKRAKEDRDALARMGPPCRYDEQQNEIQQDMSSQHQDLPQQKEHASTMASPNIFMTQQNIQSQGHRHEEGHMDIDMANDPMACSISPGQLLKAGGAKNKIKKVTMNEFLMKKVGCQRRTTGQMDSRMDLDLVKVNDKRVQAPEDQGKPPAEL